VRRGAASLRERYARKGTPMAATTRRAFFYACPTSPSALPIKHERVGWNCISLISPSPSTMLISGRGNANVDEKLAVRLYPTAAYTAGGGLYGGRWATFYPVRHMSGVSAHHFTSALFAGAAWRPALAGLALLGRTLAQSCCSKRRQRAVAGSRVRAALNDTMLLLRCWTIPASALLFATTFILPLRMRVTRCGTFQERTLPACARSAGTPCRSPSVRAISATGGPKGRPAGANDRFLDRLRWRLLAPRHALCSLLCLHCTCTRLLGASLLRAAATFCWRAGAFHGLRAPSVYTSPPTTS